MKYLKKDNLQLSVLEEIKVKKTVQLKLHQKNLK